MNREEAIYILDNLKPTNTKSSFDAYVVGKAITMAIKALEQEPCEDAVSRECNNCAYYVNGANDEACDGCFADEYEHPNFKPKAQYCEDAVSRQVVLDGLASITKAKAKSDAQKSLMGRVMFFVEQTPSVQPKPKTGWIPVSEKLPESECLLCDNEGLIFIGSYLKHCKWFEDYDENIIDDVVAWMPLPEPYKESEDKEC